MKELFYFSFAEIMARVEYQQQVNALSYATHRKMTANERALVEQYLLAKVAVKTGYYNQPRSRFNYLGVEVQLARFLEHYNCKSGTEKEQEVSALVKELINHSMQNFYFEQIGDALLALRRELRSDESAARVAPLRRKIGELVQAYNHYSEQSLNLDEVIPTELKFHLGIPTTPRTNIQAFAEEVIN